MTAANCFRSFLLPTVALAISFCPAWALHAQEVSPEVLKAQQERVAAISKATKAAVSVFAKGGQGGGSGVVVTPDGYALTNFHVVKPAGSHMKCSMPDGVLYDAVIVGIDPVGDVGLIKLLGRDDFPTAELGDSDKLRVGDWCFAVGNPFLLATDFQPTVTYGIVSGVHRYQYPAGTLLEYADCIQTDASINPGNSGGPLFNSQGQLIGINGRGSFEKRGRVNVGVGYAISINQIKHFMGYLRSGRIVDHATLGATVESDEDGHVVVANILESSDAYRRGLRYGDRIVSFGGRSIETVNAFKNVLGIYPKGWRVPLTYRSEGEQRTVLVRLASVHSSSELIAKIQGTRKPPAPPKLPKPEEKPKDGEKPKPDKKPKPMPIPIPHPGKPNAKPTPPAIAKLIVKRSGYANYYFNELNRDRIWNNFTAKGDFSSFNGAWTLTGQLADGGAVEIVLGKKEATISLPTGVEKVNLGGDVDLDTQLAPVGSGGMLVALHLWKHLLTVGLKQFGDVYYLGTAPTLKSAKPVDILSSTHNVVDANFSFDPATGRLLGIEMSSSKDADPCEIYFDDYREIDGRLLPHRLEIRYGDKTYGIIQLKDLSLAKAAEKKA